PGMEMIGGLCGLKAALLGKDDKVSQLAWGELLMRGMISDEGHWPLLDVYCPKHGPGAETPFLGEALQVDPPALDGWDTGLGAFIKIGVEAKRRAITHGPDYLD